MKTNPLDAPVTQEITEGRGTSFYIRGSLAFFRKMWPAVYDLTTTETYVSASAIAFNILLSFFSFVVLIGSFLINILHWKSGYETFYLLLRSLVPKESGQIFWSLDRVTQGPGGEATIISFGLLLFSSLGIFQPIEMALNQAWGFKERGLVRQYLVYLGLVAGCGVLMLCPVALGSIYNYLMELVGVTAATRVLVFRVIGPVISLPFIALLFFVIYYVVPNGKVEAGRIVFTSVAMSILWVLMTLLFRMALPLFAFEESYNRLAPIMAMVTWVLISSFIVILGANLTTREVLPRAWVGDLPPRFRKSEPQ